jgi:tetratricopeptide (TPR) repeat protein
MAGTGRPVTSRPAPPGDGGPPPRIAAALKWVAGGTAILSLIFGLHQLVQLVSDVRERERSAAELSSIGKQQQAAGDYAAAWGSFEQGLKVAEPGGKIAKLIGRLGEARGALRRAQEDLAIEWLRNVRVSASRGETFSRLVETLTPALHRGVASTEGPRKADLLAHLGWADFLRWRDGRREVDPEQHYRQALAVDPANPYAHAYWAHWQLWTRRAAALAEAREHFAAALAAGRAREHVRHMELSAIANLGQSGDAEYLKLVNDMRRSGETIDARTRGAAFGIYRSGCTSAAPDRFAQIFAAGSMTEHAATFEALFHAGDFDQAKARQRDACLALLLEAAGQRDQARHAWSTLRQGLSPADHEWRDRADAALGRLSRPAR